jgi:AcrR family transcriptional regulator/DNA-binding MarR family transcriptional regulator
VPRENAIAIQRSRLIAAMIEGVEDVGYGALRAGDVATRARVARKTFYDVFQDREECFCAAFEYLIGEAAEVLGQAYRREGSWREGMRAALRELFALIEENPGAARLCVVEALSASEGVARSRARAVARIADVVDRGREPEGATNRQVSASGNRGTPSRGQEAPPRELAEGVVGAVFTIIHGWLTNGEGVRLGDVLGACMYCIVVGYEGREVAAGQCASASEEGSRGTRRTAAVRERPLAGLGTRLTYRTIRVLGAIAEYPGACNREVAARAGVGDQGQMSKLLNRIAEHGLVENRGNGGTRRSGNQWHLTKRGAEILRTTQPAKATAQ